MHNNVLVLRPGMSRVLSCCARHGCWSTSRDTGHARFQAPKFESCTHLSHPQKDPEDESCWMLSFRERYYVVLEQILVGRASNPCKSGPQNLQRMSHQSFSNSEDIRWRSQRFCFQPLPLQSSVPWHSLRRPDNITMPALDAKPLNTDAGTSSGGP